MTTGHRNDPYDGSTPIYNKFMKGRAAVLCDETIAAPVQESDVESPLRTEPLSRNIFSCFVEIGVKAESASYPSRKSHLTQRSTTNTRHVRIITPTIPIKEPNSACSDSSSLNESRFKNLFAAPYRRLFRSSEDSTPAKPFKAAEKLERGHGLAQAAASDAGYPRRKYTKYWRLPRSLQWGSSLRARNTAS
ncbi:hypothetical protein DFP72DRAFT_891657 [Ephemerocybe angulata]|uniref:Uncharacterized protein n=1 Tax=Ephemerocybe angulata TaxID=980116 RepID=A0A8H6M9I5_9AGAR|nr:hypothetical protein DFP72DRAFT_891657 [Tulosesus angulatus]